MSDENASTKMMQAQDIKTLYESGGDAKLFPKFCPYKGEGPWFVPCIGTACEKGKTGECTRS